MRHSFYRFHIKNKKGSYSILIGCIWDQGQKHLYIPFEKTAFAKEYSGPFHSAQEAEDFLKDFRKKI